MLLPLGGLSRVPLEGNTLIKRRGRKGHINKEKQNGWHDAAGYGSGVSKEGVFLFTGCFLETVWLSWQLELCVTFCNAQSICAKSSWMQLKQHKQKVSALFLLKPKLEINTHYFPKCEVEESGLAKALNEAGVSDGNWQSEKQDAPSVWPYWHIKSFERSYTI